jgi:hypothetical protein
MGEAEAFHDPRSSGHESAPFENFWKSESRHVGTATVHGRDARHTAVEAPYEPPPGQVEMRRGVRKLDLK